MSDLDIYSSTQQIIVDPWTQATSVILAGPPGPGGPKGDPGDAEYGIASEAEALAGVDTTKVIVPSTLDYVFNHRLSYINVRDYGVVGDNNTDNALMIDAAINAANAMNTDVKTLVFPPGRFKTSGRHVIPQGMNLVGTGTGLEASASARWGTLLIPTGAGSGFDFYGGGGFSGGFSLDGGGVAENPLGFLEGSNREFANIYVLNAADVAVIVKQMQNSVFRQFQVKGAANVSLLLDQGAGGNHFQNLELHNVGIGGWHLVIDQSINEGPYIGLGPSHNTFDHCILENFVNDFAGCVDIHAGLRTVFRDSVLSAGPNEATTAVVRVADDSAHGTAPIITFDGTELYDTTGDTGILQSGGFIGMRGVSSFVGMTTAWVINGGTGAVWEPPSYAGVTNRWGGTQDPWVAHNNTSSRPVVIAGESGDFWLLRTSIQGEGNMRFAVTTDGSLNWGGGSAALDAEIHRVAAGVTGTWGKFTAYGGLGVGNSDLGSSPGTLVRKIEVFNEAGVSLGFVPVYDAIT